MPKTPKDQTTPPSTPVSDPSGKGNTSGGGGGGPDVLQARVLTAPGTTGAVANQPILPLDSNVFAGLSEDQRAAVRTEQLSFAKNVSQAAADAYGKILAATENSSSGTKSVTQDS